jgi:hypothetical protein
VAARPQWAHCAVTGTLPSQPPCDSAAQPEAIVIRLMPWPHFLTLCRTCSSCFARLHTI